MLLLTGNQCFGSTPWDDGPAHVPGRHIIGSSCMIAALIIVWLSRLLNQRRCAGVVPAELNSILHRKRFL
jgi:hypothetical protein